MAEHDYVIANQNGANTRSDLNNALAAIVSNNSKATAPTTTYAYMWWADTANDILKQRNGADSAWISILTLSTGAPLATIANFTSTGIDDNATSTALTITNTGVEVKAGGTYSTASGNDLNIDIPSTRSLFIKNAGTTAMTIDNTGNVTVNTGNLVIGTSGKGIDFSADGNAGGMTSEVLDDYEEGTWTPTLDSGTNITYTSQSGRYTKIGGFVHCTAEIVVSNSNSDGSNIAISGLPYTGNSDEEAVNATLGRYIGFLGAKATAMRNVRFTGTSLLLMEGDNLAIAYNEIASSGTLQIAFTYTT